MAAQRRMLFGRPQGDEGHADPNVTATLSAYHQALATEQEALLAVASARLLVPVVAMLSFPPRASVDEATGAEKESEMALPTLIGNDGRAAIIAFTGVETMTRWRPDARPVPTPAARVWHAAVAEGQAVVVDVAGPVPLVVEGARLEALAAGEAPPLPHEDPDVHAVIEQAAAAEPAVLECTLAPSAEGGELAVTLRVATAADVDAARRAAGEIAARLSARFRRGVEFSASR
jgi:SseB protein N-terminal domain